MSIRIKIFTTRPDTIFGATFLVVSPEVAQKWIEVGWDASASVREYVTASLKREEMDRTAEGKEKTGVDTGVVAMNPANGKQIPVWIADFVLGHYGTGAVFADAHDQRDFDFAKKYNIPLKVTIKPDDAELWKKVKNLEECYEGDGEHFDSEFLNGLRVKEAVEKVIDWIETKGVGRRTIQYKLRDWVFSRQRYWGEPIPLVYCDKCGDENGVVALPETASSLAHLVGVTRGVDVIVYIALVLVFYLILSAHFSRNQHEKQCARDGSPTS